MIQATQAAIEEEARKRLAVMQAQEETERAKREEAARLEAEREKAAQLETDRMLAKEDAVREEAKRQQQLAEDQRLASEQAEKDISETTDVVATPIPSATSEESSSHAARLDAVDQRMDKFSEHQEDMKKQMESFGDVLKIILERLPEKRP